MKVFPELSNFGARITGLDLSTPLETGQKRQIERLLGRHGVICFPLQNLSAQQLRAFSAQFGTLEINVANSFPSPGFPEVMILSNIVRDGKAIGLSDAGQGWHTDMSYNDMIAFANVLHAIEIPVRDGKPLGSTEFCNTQAAYAALPDSIKQRIRGKTVLHDFNKFWEMMRCEKGSTRPPLTQDQRRSKPPVTHPIHFTHPISGREVLYANPGYSMQINELPAEESDELLAFLFEHQTQEPFRYRHFWTVGDVLMWDNIGTIHNAVADYGPDDHRLILRCQVMADRYFKAAA